MDEKTNTGDWKIVTEPVIQEFGGYRAIGMNCISDNKNGEFPALWKRFMSRWNEIQISQDKDRGLAYGFCRCVPGKTDGSFEYIAALTAEPNAPIPEGMLDVQIPRASYVVFTVRNLTEIFKVWEYTRAWFEAHPEWDTYCSPKGCDCSHYPCFELYPVDFCDDKPLYIYFPVKPNK